MEKGDGVSAAQVLPGKERLSASLLTFDNHDFNARYPGIPVGGYTRMVENMLEGLEVRLGSYRYYDMDQVIAAALDASGNR